VSDTTTGTYPRYLVSLRIATGELFRDRLYSHYRPSTESTSGCSLECRLADFAAGDPNYSGTGDWPYAIVVRLDLMLPPIYHRASGFNVL
jgi:hypothetical protein